LFFFFFSQEGPRSGPFLADLSSFVNSPTDALPPLMLHVPLQKVIFFFFLFPPFYQTPCNGATPGPLTLLPPPFFDYNFLFFFPASIDGLRWGGEKFRTSKTGRDEIEFFVYRRILQVQWIVDDVFAFSFFFFVTLLFNPVPYSRHLSDHITLAPKDRLRFALDHFVGGPWPFLRHGYAGVRSLLPSHTFQNFPIFEKLDYSSLAPALELLKLCPPPPLLRIFTPVNFLSFYLRDP